MKNKTKIIIALFTLVFMMPFLILPTSAFTLPQTYWPGSVASGAFIPEGSGIIMESQSIRFDISEFPTFDDAERIAEYKGSVETEYTFLNPTDNEITVTLVYPIGKAPNYKYGVLKKIDPANYSVTVNGEATEVSLRHGYDANYLFDPEVFAEGITDEYIDNGICGPDMTVTKYTFKHSDLEATYAYAGFDVKESELDGSCLYLGAYGRAWSEENGDLRCSVFLGNESEDYILYVFGNDLKILPEWKIYEDASVRDGEEIEGKMELVAKETLTFSEFVFSDYDESLGINKIDWFNMAATELTLTMEAEYVFTSLNGFNTDFTDCMVSGLVYELTLRPGESVVNKLSAPIYPDVDEGYEPNLYTYNYMLATGGVLPLNKINISVNTPYYLSNSSLEYEKSEDGYSVSIDPTSIENDAIDDIYHNIYFDICESENPETAKPEVPAIIWILLIIFIPIVLVIAVISLVIDGVEFVINKIKGGGRK